MIGLVIGEVELEQVEPLVDGLGQSKFPHQEMDGADAAAGDGPRLVGDLVLDVDGSDDRLWRGGGDGSVEAAPDFALAGGVMAVWNRFHSKSPRGDGHGICCRSIQCAGNAGRFRVSTHQSGDSNLRPRLVKD
jgi:hypothetical protein